MTRSRMDQRSQAAYAQVVSLPADRTGFAKFPARELFLSVGVLRALFDGEKGEYESGPMAPADEISVPMLVCKPPDSSWERAYTPGENGKRCAANRGIVAIVLRILASSRP